MMKKVCFTESQIVSILKLADCCMKIAEICRQKGIGNATHCIYGQPRFASPKVGFKLLLTSVQHQVCV